MPDFDVVELEATNHPTAGDEAPDFVRPLVNAEFWEDVALSDLTADSPVVLVFHPMDGAFPAIYIWNEIRDRGWSDEITVVGLSVSSPYEHKSLIEERGIDARLFSDPQNGVAEQYDIVNGLDGMAGVAEPRPAVFVIDGEQTVEHAWVAEEWPDFPAYDDIESAINAL